MLRLCFFIFIFSILLSYSSSAQNSFHAVLRDSITDEKLTGVAVIIKGTSNGNTSDANGKISISNIPDGKAVIIFSLLSYQKKEIEFVFPLADAGKIFEVKLSPVEHEMEEVIISSTRTNSRIEDAPLKTEVIGTEEMDEESNLEPETIGSIIGDVSGIQIQQTSAVSCNSNLRIQGLSGKYAQILRDGVPLFDGFSGGFSVLEMPPVDLRQIEIIKGPASTLFGGGAISGIVNVISKQPADSAKNILSLNETSLKETNLNFFHSSKRKKTSYTLYAGANNENAVDIDHDGFSDQPDMQSVLLHPQIFFQFNPSTKLKAGYSGTIDNSYGGDMTVISGTSDTSHVYFQKNNTLRNTVDASLEHKRKNGNLFTVKAAASLYNRKVKEHEFRFDGRQLSFYSELAYVIHSNKNDVVLGTNLKSEALTIVHSDNALIHGHDFFTTGFFAQDDWRVTKSFTVQSGLRADRHNEYGWFVLPQLNFLYKFSSSLSARLNGGLGYTIPDMFISDEADADLRNAVAISSFVKAEKSSGVNFDVNYRHSLGKYFLTLNQAFFYTRIESPVSAAGDSSGKIVYWNYYDAVETKGAETYLRLKKDEWDLYLGYTYTQPERISADGKRFPSLLNAKNKYAAVLTYEAEGNWKTGVEASYMSSQYVRETEQREGYWFAAVMIQKNIKKFSITLNCENLFDFRQTKKEAVVLPPYTNPTFRPLWAPLEGRIANLSVRFSW